MTYYIQTPFSIFSLKQMLLEKYANIMTNRVNNNKYLIHTNYFKEMQLIFILIFILKFDFLYKSILNNNSNNSSVLINSTMSKDIYINKEFWQLYSTSYQSLPQAYLTKTNNEIANNKYKEFELIDNSKSYFYFQLSNYHSFLISNLTIIILLFVLKPSILLSSTRLLSLSIFTY
jgi:hypothetical protein